MNNKIENLIINLKKYESDNLSITEIEGGNDIVLEKIKIQEEGDDIHITGFREEMMTDFTYILEKQKIISFEDAIINLEVLTNDDTIMIETW